MAKLTISLAAAIAALAVASSGAGAGTTTVGVDLATVSPGNPYNCSATSECTLANSFINLSSEEEGGGAFSLVNGTITSWQLKTGAGGASAVRLRVVRPIDPLHPVPGFTGAGTSAMVNAAPFSVTSFPASLPIRENDLIGLDCCQSGNDAVNTPNTSARVWGSTGLGPLADGSTRAGDALTPLAGLMLNATIDVADDLRIVSKPKLRGGKVRMQAEVPNPGSMDLAAKRGLLRRSSGFYDSAGRQEISLALTTEGRALLREGGRLKAKIKVLYEPIYGGELVRRKVRAVVKR